MIMTDVPDEEMGDMFDVPSCCVEQAGQMSPVGVVQQINHDSGDI